MKKKLVIFLSGLLALMTLLSACAEIPAEPVESTADSAVEGTDTTIVEEVAKLFFVENKTAKVTIIRPENFTTCETETASNGFLN